MTDNPVTRLHESIEAIYRAESRWILATLIRLLGDFDLAEDALHDAFRAALEKWPQEGIPANPFSWLVSAGRFKALDGIRRRVRFDDSQEAIADQLYRGPGEMEVPDDGDIRDDRLRLV